jgi:hypothetical protein
MADPIVAPDLTNYTKITVPGEDPNNVQAKKHFVFNETGNIMLSTTDEKSDTIDKGVRDVFAEVSVFFAAMTKAISTTVDPDSKTGRYYSLYNYDALEAVIDGSGCFIHVAQQDVTYSINSWGVNFSKDLIKSLLGLATGTGELAFASAMVSSIGEEGLNISGDSTKSDSEVANIIFVCEYLLGMPIVSAIVVRAKASMASQTFTLGPCFKEHTESRDLQFHKDTYMFVTPSFIANYAGDLDKGMSDPAFLTLTSNFQKILTRTPLILNVTTTDRVPMDAPANLKIGQRYRLGGNFFGPSTIDANSKKETGVPLTGAKVELMKADGTIAADHPIGTVYWSDESIDFSVGGTVATGTEGQLYTIKVTMPPKTSGTQGDHGTPQVIVMTSPRAFGLES